MWKKKFREQVLGIAGGQWRQLDEVVLLGVTDMHELVSRVSLSRLDQKREAQK